MYNEHILTILVSLFGNETRKNVLANLKRDKMCEFRLSNEDGPPVPVVEAHKFECYLHQT